MRSVISISGKSQSRKCDDRRLERDQQAARADADEAGEPLRDLDPCEALLARLRIAHGDAEAQATGPRCTGRAGRGRRRAASGRDRSGWRTPCGARRARLRSRRRPSRRGSPRGASAGQSSSRQSRDWLAVSCVARSRTSISVCCGVRPSADRTESPDATWSSSPATRTMKNSSRIDETIPQNRTRSSSGSAAVGGDLEHARHQVERGKLAVQQRQGLVFGIHSLGCRHRRRIS